MSTPDWTAARLAALCGAMGTLHFLAPRPFDQIIPPNLPGRPRFWTLASGLAELITAALLAHPRTRRLGGAAALGLFVAVFPANVQMAWNARRGPVVKRSVSLARLPLQAVLVHQANRVRTGTSSP